MRDDDTNQNQPDQPDDGAGSSDSSSPPLPASLIFMEMMRAAAARAAADQAQAFGDRVPPGGILAPSELFVPGFRRDTAAPPPFPQATDAATDSPPDPDPMDSLPEPSPADEDFFTEAAAPGDNPAPEPDDALADLPESEEAEATEIEDEAPAADEADAEPASEPLPAQPLTEAERQHAAAMEVQRLRRVKKRQAKRRARRVSVLGGVVRSFLVIIPSALLMATILSWWTDPQFLKAEVRAGLQAAIVAEGLTPTPTVFVPTPNWLRRIGIVSGHNGPRPDGIMLDPGAVCEDAAGNVIITEREINLDVASRVVRGLRERGYSVDLLDEFDPRLQNYQAAALISIHANTCQDFGELVSGFLVAKADARPEGGIDTRLAECIARYYGSRSGLDRRFGLTRDMTEYHSFSEIHPATPASIIELGFMLADRPILTENPDALATGIIEGALCFLEPDYEQQNPPRFGSSPTPPDGTGTPDPLATPTPVVHLPFLPVRDYNPGRHLLTGITLPL